MSTKDETEERAGINWVQVVAAALAAMSSAVLLSTLGVAGTIIGAAVGSLTASVAGAVYSRGIDVSRHQVASQASALRRVTLARTQLDQARGAVERGETGAQTRLSRADQALDDAENALHEGEAPGGAAAGEGAAAAEPDATQELVTDQRSWRDLPWKRIAVIAALVFVIAMAAITTFELLSGRSVSSYTGGSDKGTGSTIPGLGGGADEATKKPDQPEQSATPSEPTESPSETPSSASPSETPSATPSGVPSLSPSPTLNETSPSESPS